MQQEHWLRTTDFARAQGISLQAARAAVRTALKKRTWRGQSLEVRVAIGRGGRAGTSYEIRSVGGLDAPAPLEGGRTTVVDPTASSRLALISEILEHPAATISRSSAVHRSAMSAGVSPRTVYRWLKLYEQHGVRGLSRAKPSNAGRRRVHVSRSFDRAFMAAGAPAKLLTELAAELQRALRGLWASRAANAGAQEVRRLAEHLLKKACEERGIALPAESYRISRRYAERYAHFRVVNQHRTDRKAFDDAKPRIRRDWTGLFPMERVVADVKHLDVIVRRPDGGTAWPKIIAFMDAGTGRVFAHPIILDKGEGVRQEHVVEAFLAMVAEPNWGFPQGLYLDNGSEFGGFERIDRALQLLNEPGARTLIYAQPYNAAAKPIESLFARLDRYVFSLLPGYAGPDRMAKKTQSVGKPTAPFSGDWDQFCAVVGELIRAYNFRPVGGAWANRSPESWLSEKISNGWRPVTVAPAELDAAFAESDSRRVDRGVLKIAGRRYTHDLLAALPSRTVVDLALPWRRGAAPLANLGGSWVYLQPERLYPARWIEGARESSRRQKLQADHVAALKRQAPLIDPVQIKIEWARQQGRSPVTPASPPVDLGEDVRELGKAVRPTSEAPSQLTAAERRRAREMALTERLERAQASHD